MQTTDMESTEVFPILLVWDRYVGKFPIIQNFTNGTYSENVLRHTLDANFEFKRVKVDNKPISLKIWYIPGAGKLLTNYNKNIPSPTIQQVLEFFDKIKTFILFFDLEHANYEFLERIFKTLEKNYKESNYILVAIKNDTQNFNDYEIIENFKLTFPKLKEFVPNLEKTNESLEHIYKIAGKLIIEK